MPQGYNNGAGGYGGSSMPDYSAPPPQHSPYGGQQQGYGAPQPDYNAQQQSYGASPNPYGGSPNPYGAASPAHQQQYGQQSYPGQEGAPDQQPQQYDEHGNPLPPGERGIGTMAMGGLAGFAGNKMMGNHGGGMKAAFGGAALAQGGKVSRGGQWRARTLADTTLDAHGPPEQEQEAQRRTRRRLQ